MHDSLESELIAAHLAPFRNDEAAWIDAYVTARSTLDRDLEAASVTHAARLAWSSHGWAHPAVVARLEGLFGPLSCD